MNEVNQALRSTKSAANNLRSELNELVAALERDGRDRSDTDPWLVGSVAILISTEMLLHVLEVWDMQITSVGSRPTNNNTEEPK